MIEDTVRLFRRVAASGIQVDAFLVRWPRAGSPAEHLGWGASLLHCAPLALVGPKMFLTKLKVRCKLLVAKSRPRGITIEHGSP